MDQGSLLYIWGSTEVNIILKILLHIDVKKSIGRPVYKGFM